MRRATATPESASWVSTFESCAERDDGQMEYTAIAQVYNRVNLRLMRFRRGTFGKTVQEGVPAGRVKINVDHNPSVEAAVGTMIEARETDAGLWYRGLLSSTQKDLHTKLREGHVQENSIEFYSIDEDVGRVDLSEIPDHAPLWSAPVDGKVEIRDILEAQLIGIGLVMHSAQGVPAILEVNSAIPYQDLPVSECAWDPDGAATRLARWAGTVTRKGAQSVPNWAKLSAGYLLRGPIVDGKPQFLGAVADVIDGRLVVVREALDSAMESLASVEGIRPADIVAASNMVRRYEAKLAKSPVIPVESRTQADQPAGPAIDKLEESPTESKSEAAAIERGLLLMSLRLRAAETRHQEVNHEPASAGGKPASTVSQGV